MIILRWAEAEKAACGWMDGLGERSMIKMRGLTDVVQFEYKGSPTVRPDDCVNFSSVIRLTGGRRRLGAIQLFELAVQGRKTEPEASGGLALVIGGFVQDSLDVKSLVVAKGPTQVVAGVVGAIFDDQSRREIVGGQDRPVAEQDGAFEGIVELAARCRAREPPSALGSSGCRHRRLAYPACLACFASRAATSPGMSSRRSRRGADESSPR